MKTSSLASHYIAKAIAILGQNPEIATSLATPKQVLSDIITLSSKGKKLSFPAYRVQHDDCLGPFKGGIRFHPKVTEEEVRTLAFLMSIKCSLIAIPFGGAKGGVCCNPKDLTKKELESIARSYIKLFYKKLGQDNDIPAPDMNTNPTVMSWMLDEYEKLVQHHEPSCITGKPLDLGGSKGRTQATGYGGAMIISELIKTMNKKPSQMTVAIQGFGNVGYYLAQKLEQEGFRIVAISDSKGGIYSYNKMGFDVDTVMNCKKKQGYLAGCYCVGGVCDVKNGKIITNEELLELPVDILIPSASEHVIHKDNMTHIKAPIIVEMANDPLTLEADEYLTNNHTVIVPDVLANAGGVTVSYFEWVQGRMGYYWEEKEVMEKLEQKMLSAFSKTWSFAKQHAVPLRTAAYALAIERIQTARKLRGQ